jgi:4-hydroxybenzoate polyprenyltransferase
VGIARTVKGYLDLCRITNLPSIWTNVLCASVLAAGLFSWQGFMIPAMSLSCFYLAGMCVNDICDAGHDRVHRPSRPIPSGSVSPQGALFLTGILFLSGAGLLLKAPHRQGFYASFLLLVVIVWYDLNHKQNPFSVLLMASCRFLVFVVTSLAMTGTIAAAIWCAAAIQFSYVVCISLVARFENRRPFPFTLPVIPLMLAGIPLLDGIILAVVINMKWLLAGIAGALLMQAGQRIIRGD